MNRPKVSMNNIEVDRGKFEDLEINSD